MTVRVTPRDKARLAFAAVLGVGAAVFVYWTAYNGAFASAAALVSYSGRGTAAVFGLLALLAGAWVFLLLAQVFCNYYVFSVDRVLAVTYVAAVLWVILGKSVGIKEVNWEITDLFAQVRYFPAGLFLNMAMFVPLGLLIRIKTSSAPKALVLASVTSAILEAVQYAFALGIADVCDVAANVFGVMVGFFVVDAVMGRGYRFKRTSPSTAAFVHAKHACPASRGNLVVLSALGAAVLAFAAGVALYPVKPLSPVPVAYKSEDPLLLKLEESSTATTNALEALPARIAGQERRVGIAEVTQEGLALSGAAVGWSFWLTDSGDLAGGLSVLEVAGTGDITVSTAVPVVVTPATRITLGDRALSIEELREALYSNQAYRVSATATKEGSWLKAAELELLSSDPVSPETPVVTFDWSDYSSLVGKKPSRDTWLDLSECGTDSVAGYLASTTSFDNRANDYATIAVVDNASGVPVLHGVNAGLGHDVEDWGRNSELATFELTFRDGVVEVL